MAPFVYFGHTVDQNTSSGNHNFASSAGAHTPIIKDQHDWQYLSEGASNIIYRYTGSCSLFSGYLLRLRKCLPGTPSTLSLFTTLQNTFLPSLGADIVCPTILVRLAPGVATRFNRSLVRWVRRDGKGVGTSVIGSGAVDETEEYAMLVQDMSCGQWALGKGPPLDSGNLSPGVYEMHSASNTGWMDVAMIEFKPRWLAQSADAPSDWNFCRGCALRQMQTQNSVTYMPLQETRMRYHHRRSCSADSGVAMLDEDEDHYGEDQEQSRGECGPEEDEGENEDEEEESYCPLDLSSHDPHRIFRAAKAILHTTAGEVHCTDLDIDQCAEDLDADIDSGSDLPLATAVAEVLLEHFTQWLSPGHHGAEVISRLCRIQEKWGRHGVFIEGDQEMEEVGWAMAVRDCSMLVRVWARWIDGGEGGGEIGGKVQTIFECRVADLDVKGGKGGGGVYWKNVERRLTHGGWYEACDGDGTRGCR